jgi:hypothetical protein
LFPSQPKPLPTDCTSMHLFRALCTNRTAASPHPPNKQAPRVCGVHLPAARTIVRRNNYGCTSQAAMNQCDPPYEDAAEVEGPPEKPWSFSTFTTMMCLGPYLGLHCGFSCPRWGTPRASPQPPGAPGGDITVKPEVFLTPSRARATVPITPHPPGWRGIDREFAMHDDGWLASRALVGSFDPAPHVRVC